MPLILTPGRLNERAELYHQVGIMLSAGITLPQALEQAQRNAPWSLRPVIRKLLEGLSEGLTLTDSIETLGRWIPSFDAALLEAGEKSGRLDAIFKLLAIYYRDRAQLARQVISELMYPLFLFHFAVFIFPLVKWIQTTNTMQFLGTMLLILGPLYGGTFLIVYACQGRHGEHWRHKLESVLAPIPVLGTARHYLALARLSAALEALLTAGVSIIPAWELAGTASGSTRLQRLITSWKEPMDAGRTPSEMVSSSQLFPELFAGLYQTGEVSGKLDETLQRLHLIYQDDGSRKLRAVARWTPKAVYMIIMLLIAWKLISFWYGYYGPGGEVDKAINGNL